MDPIKITKLSNIQSKKGTESSFEAFCKFVQEDTQHKKNIDKIRAEQDKDKRRASKQLLPQILPSGLFLNGVTDYDCTSYTGVLFIDIDEPSGEWEAGKLKERIKELPYFESILFLCLSAGGLGIHVFYKTNATQETHTQYYNSIGLEFKRIGIAIDLKCKNIARKVTVSSDQTPYQNLGAVALTLQLDKFIPFVDFQNPEQQASPEKDTQTIESIILYFQNSKDQFCDDYGDWVKICFALVNTFESEKAWQYFNELSKCSDKYNEHDCRSKFDKIQHTASLQDNRVTIASLIKIAKDAGWVPQQHTAIQNKSIISSLNAPKQQVRSLHDTTNKPTLLTEFFETEHIFRDRISKKFYVKGSKLEAIEKNDLRLLASNAIDFTERMWDTFINSTKRTKDGFGVNEFDFLTAYFEGLVLSVNSQEKHDKQTAACNIFVKFFKAINLDYSLVGQKEEERTDFQKTIRSNLMAWFLKCIDSLYGNINTIQLRFQSPKVLEIERFIQALLPDELKQTLSTYKYIDSTFDKIKTEQLFHYDHRCNLCDKLSVGLISLLEENKIEYRAQYAQDATKAQRIVNYIASTEEVSTLDFSDLNAVFVIPIESIDFEKLKQVNMKEVWAALMWLYKNSTFAFELHEMNLQLRGIVERQSTESDLIYKYCRQPNLVDASECNCYHSATDVLYHFQMVTKKMSYSMTVQGIGRAMKAAGFQQKSTTRQDDGKRGYFYFVKLL